MFGSFLDNLLVSMNYQGCEQKDIIELYLYCFTKQYSHMH